MMPHTRWMGEREYNNTVMCNRYVICSDKEVLDNAVIPGVSLECNLSKSEMGSDCIPGVDICQMANKYGLKNLSMLLSPQEWMFMCP